MDTESSITIITIGRKKSEGERNYQEAGSQTSFDHPTAVWTKKLDREKRMKNDAFGKDDDDLDGNESEQEFKFIARKKCFVRRDTFDIFEKAQQSLSKTSLHNRRKIQFNDEVTYLKRSFSFESSLESFSRRESVGLYNFNENESPQSDLERCFSSVAVGEDFTYDSENEYMYGGWSRNRESQGILKSSSRSRVSIKPRVMFGNRTNGIKCGICSGPNKADDSINPNKEKEQKKHLVSNILHTNHPVQQPSAYYSQLTQQKLVLPPPKGYQTMGYMIPIQPDSGYSDVAVNELNARTGTEIDSESSTSGDSNAKICDNNITYDSGIACVYQT